jgi:RimJ/RimL family protein N-acetyltransferase
MSLTLRLMDRADYDQLAPCLPSDTARDGVLARLHHPGLHLSVVAAGQLIACGGITLLWAGVGEGWFAGRLDLPRHRRGVARALRTWTPRLCELLGLHRLEASVRCDDARGVRLINWLGFQYEATRRQYGPAREDYHVYTRLRKEEPWPPPSR